MAHAHTKRFQKLMDKERKLVMQGKGAFAEAQAQLDAEAAEKFYEEHRKNMAKIPRARYEVGTEELIGKWAGRVADMIYTRKKKRNNKGGK